METAPLKSFATWARRELITQVSARLTAVLAPSSPERIEHPNTVATLERDIVAAGGGAKGNDVITDRVAYTWFNRIIALRFMDANGYTGIGVVSPAHGQQIGQPEILADAKRGNIDPAVVTNKRIRDAISGLLDGTRLSGDPQGEAYTLLLAEYCRYWNRAMPFIFEREGDYTELLIPANLLAADSILSRAVTVLTEETCREVEVIGWLYQFYISERKDEVFAGFKKGKKAGAAEIPAATQLFTPDWIVRYLVENSIGRLWMLNHPESRLIDQMEYYIAPVDEETDFLKLTSPEKLTVIDPACGSGHMLTYAFDLLYAIYEEEGYAPSQIPELILTHNLFGTEIDPRAGALAAFALTMKARQRQRTYLRSGVGPNICVLKPISFEPDEIDALVAEHGDLTTDETFWNAFEHADTFGSLIRLDAHHAKSLANAMERVERSVDLVHHHLVGRARTLARQARLLSDSYAVVVTNPPYMGSKQMNALLSQFMKDNYPESKSDLFAAFIERAMAMVVSHGYMAQVTMQSWMFLSSYEKLRLQLRHHASIVTLLHMDNMVMRIAFGTSATVWKIGGGGPSAGKYTWITLDDLKGGVPHSFPPRNARNATAGADGHFTLTQAGFDAIPGSPIVYWLSEKMRAAFSIGRPLREIADLRQGLATADNNRFLRQWWEVSNSRTAFSCTTREEAASSRARWFPYNKGGEFRKWYGNQEHVVNWENDGSEIRSFGTELGGRPRSRAQNTDTYFSPSVSWSDISSGEAAFRRYPAGFIHDSTGHSGFGDPGKLDQLALLLNSSFVVEVMKVVAPTLHFHIGYVGLVPIASGIREMSAESTDQLVQTSQQDWDSVETSWNFAQNPLIALASELAGDRD